MKCFQVSLLINSGALVEHVTLIHISQLFNKFSVTKFWPSNQHPRKYTGMGTENSSFLPTFSQGPG